MPKVQINIEEIRLEDNNKIDIKTALWNQDVNDGEGGFNFITLRIQRVGNSELHIEVIDSISNKRSDKKVVNKLIFHH